MLDNNLGIKTPAQIQAEKDEPAKSEVNNSRLGAAAIGVPVVGGLGYLGYQGLSKGADVVSKIEPYNIGHGAVTSVKDTFDAAGNLVDSTGSILKTAAELAAEAGTNIVKGGVDVVKGAVDAFNESTLIVPGTTLSYMQEAFDFNALADKAKANAGLLAGGIGAGLATAGAMPDAVDAQEVGLGTKALGAGLMGTAGAGIGHVIHKKIKDNSAEHQGFQDYKKLNEMPAMPAPQSNYKY